MTVQLLDGFDLWLVVEREGCQKVSVGGYLGESVGHLVEQAAQKAARQSTSAESFFLPLLLSSSVVLCNLPLGVALVGVRCDSSSGNNCTGTVRVGSRLLPPPLLLWVDCAVS